MYLEEEMQGQQMTQEEQRRWIYVSTRIDHLLNEQHSLRTRLEALEQPLSAFEDQPSLVEAMRENRDRIADEKRAVQDQLDRALSENEKLAAEVLRLRSRLQMMQAGYNAIATIQARLDANEQEMEGQRCCTG